MEHETVNFIFSEQTTNNARKNDHFRMILLQCFENKLKNGRWAVKNDKITMY